MALYIITTDRVPAYFNKQKESENMKLYELLSIVKQGETICIQDISENVLELNTKEYLQEKYKYKEVECFYSERYNAISTIGITVTIKL